MRAGDIHDGMDVAVYTGGSTKDRATSTTLLRAKVVSTGEDASGRTYGKRRDGTRVHFYERAEVVYPEEPEGDEESHPAEWAEYERLVSEFDARDHFHPDRFTDELREYDPEASNPHDYPETPVNAAGERVYWPKDGEFPEYVEAKRLYEQGSLRSNQLRSAQQVIRNANLVMPWDEYVEWRENRLKSKAEMEQRWAREKREAEAEFKALRKRVRDLGLGLDLEQGSGYMRSYGYSLVFEDGLDKFLDLAEAAVVRERVGRTGA